MDAIDLPLTDTDFHCRIQQHLTFLYPEHDQEQLLQRLLEVFDGYHPPAPPSHLWTEADSVLITYGDSIKNDDASPLQTLADFLNTYVQYSCSSVHILPFSPHSSDDGFAVIDYREVDPNLGSWSDLTRIANHYRLMGDLVINHVSSQSEWFQNYCAGKTPGSGFFIECEPDTDLTEVVRPRTSDLLRPTKTAAGDRHVWCTFSHDQVDLDFSNPEVLIEMLAVIRLYLEQGIRIFRLDAVGFLWKEIGTSCIHLPQTHEVIRLIRMLTDHFAPGTILITETNVPNHENLSYFGSRNEAHIVYNFSLAPLVVHALLTGETAYLKRWMMSMPPAPVGCTYLNFTASHDGIGMRPAEGLLSDEDQTQMVDTIKSFGGRISSRRKADGSESVYELNISLFDAMKGTVEGEDQWQQERFLCSQTIMMAIEGIPAFYIHSLLATPNDYEGVQRTGQNRSINRRKLQYSEVVRQLDDESSQTGRIFRELNRRLKIRARQPAFHPNATQFTLQPAACFFAFWRQSMDRTQSVFAVHNMTAETQELTLTDLNLISLDEWYDLLSGESIRDINGTIAVQPYQCLWITNREPDQE